MKRPLVVFVIFYILGIIVAYNYAIEYSIISVFFVIVFCTIIFKKYHIRIILFSPIIFIIAIINMNYSLDCMKCKTDNIFEYKIESEIKGIIKDYEINQEKLILKIKVNHININGKINKCNFNIIAYSDNQDDTNVKIGNKVLINGNLLKLSKPTNQGQWNEFLYYNIRKINYKFYCNDITIINSKYNNIMQNTKNIKIKLRDTYYKLLPEKQAGIVVAMILGDKIGLDKDTKEAYQASGIAHILAISGLHIGLIFVALYKLIKKIKLNNSITVLLTSIILVFYCYLTGSSISTIRAVIMIMVVMLAQIFGRNYDLITSASTTALILLLVNPLYLLDIGFLFSFSSVIGISILTPIINKYIKSKNNFTALFSVSIAAYISTLPILIYFYYEIPLYSIIINIIVIPLLSLLVPLAIIGGLVGLISITLGKLVIGCVYFVLLLYEKITELNLLLPYHTILLGHKAFFYVVLIIAVVFIIYLVESNKLKITILTSSVAIIMLITFLPEDLMVTFIDVSQGDSIFIKSRDGKTCLIDGGGDVNKNIGLDIVLPFLKYNGVGKINYMFMTHSDSDHVLGLIEIIDKIEVEYLFMPDTNLQDELYKELLTKAENNKVKVVMISNGYNIQSGLLNIECYNPYKNINSNSNNEYSMVLGVEYKNFKLLLTGDIESKQESMLVQDLDKEYQFLKVPHHGSKTSSTKEFIKCVNPSTAIISSGRNNKFGHPHQEVVDRYIEYGTIIYNTALDGAITICSNGEKSYISTFLH